MDRSTIAVPLLRRIRDNPDGLAAAYPVIIVPNLEFATGREEALNAIRSMAGKITGADINSVKTELSEQYVFGKFTGDAVQQIVRDDRAAARIRPGSERSKHAIYRIWYDEPVQA